MYKTTITPKLKQSFMDPKPKLKENLNYVVGSKSFRPDIQKPRQMEKAVRDI